MRGRGKTIALARTHRKQPNRGYTAGKARIRHGIIVPHAFAIERALPRVGSVSEVY